MKTLRISATVDEDHQLHAEVPDAVPPGPVDILLVVPPGTELHRSVDWMAQVAHQWKAELNSTDEDIYHYYDGEPVDGTR